MSEELNMRLMRLTPECREAIDKTTLGDYSQVDLLRQIFNRVRGFSGVIMMASDDRDILFPKDVSEVAWAIREQMEVAIKILDDFERQFGRDGGQSA